MKTLEIIVAELKRQEAHALGRIDDLDKVDLHCVGIDGALDLVALAAAIDKGRRGSYVDPTMVEIAKPPYSGEIRPDMLFTWMRGTQAECLIKVKRISYACPDNPWVYAMVLLAADKRTVGKEYGNEMSRFREAVELESRVAR